MTRSAELLQDGDPAGALKALTDEVRAKPADAKLRIFMAQLLCVLGQWERALNQLNVAADLDALAVPMKQMYGDAIRCEGLRADVFAGTRTPMVFGQPDEWLALLIESLLRQGSGDAATGRGPAPRAPSTPRPPRRARIDGAALRLAGRCRHAPRPGARGLRQRPLLLGAARAPGARQVRSARRPARLRLDCRRTCSSRTAARRSRWCPRATKAREKSSDGALQLARKTEWRELRPELLGRPGPAHARQRRRREHALMDVREILFDAAPSGRRRRLTRTPMA